MTDQPDQPPEQRLPAERPSEPAPPAERPAVPTTAERFTAPPSAHKRGLTPERAARIVRASASSRAVGFIAVIIVALFISGYYFYELGIPGVEGSGRQAAELEDQQVKGVELGYNVYQANCARCHGTDGQGGIGPVLNDQVKLYDHLNEEYLRNIFYVGGRLACGNATSIMPVWDNRAPVPGPLNYQQIDNLVAYLRATNDTEYTQIDPEFLTPVVDPETGEVQTFTGWRDPAWTPAPGATPYPACWADAFASGGDGSGGSGGDGGASPAPSQEPGGAVLTIGAEGIAFDKDTLEAPADQAFQIAFENRDAGVPHNVEIRDSNGASLFKGEIFNGVDTRTYDVPALPAGTYTFICTVHPNMIGTLTVK